MTVSHANGFEAQHTYVDTLGTFGFGGAGGSAFYDTSNARTGAACLGISVASGSAAYLAGPTWTGYAHFALRVHTFPSVDRIIFGQSASGVNLRLTSDGHIKYYDGGTQFGLTSSVAISADTWYWIGVKKNNGGSDVVLQIDGVDAITNSVTSGSSTLYLGCSGTEASGIELFFDDVVVDDSGFLAPSKVDIALPISDNGSHTGWQAGAGGASNLYDAVNNTPPAGVASGSETNTSNIEAVASVGGQVSFNMETYSTLGLVSGDTVIGARYLVRHGEDISTGTKNGTMQGASNPTISDSTNFTFGSDGGAHAADGAGVTTWVTYVSGWATTPGSVTLGTSPTVTFARALSESRVGCVDFVGLLVVWTPAAAPTRVPRSTPYPQILAH